MKLCVFLGNPGKQYEDTRHNAGFLAGDFLQNSWKMPLFSLEKNFFGMLTRLSDILFLKPQTFMNLSGKSVGTLVHFFRIPPENILLIFDDKDLLFGEVRFRLRGGSGGHNGVADIFRHLGTPEVARIKIGVGHADFSGNTADFVLSSFTPEEKLLLPTLIFPKIEEKMNEWIHTSS